MNDGNSAGGPAAASSSVDHPPAVTGGRRPITSRAVNQVNKALEIGPYHCIILFYLVLQMSHVGSAMPSSNQPARNLNFEKIAQTQSNLKQVGPQQPLQFQSHQQQSQSTPKTTHAQTLTAVTQFHTATHSSRPIVVDANLVPSRVASGGGLSTGPNDVSRMFPSAFPTATPSPNHCPAASNVVHPSSNATSLDAATQKKRLKGIGGATDSTLIDPASEQHCVALRKRILDHKYSRLKHVKDK